MNPCRILVSCTLVLLLLLTDSAEAQVVTEASLGPGSPPARAFQTSQPVPMGTCGSLNVLATGSDGLPRVAS